MKQLFALLLPIFIFLSACSTKELSSAPEAKLLEQKWEQIEQEAKNTKIRMFMWGGDEGINHYMDEWVAPKLKKQYGITFERIPMDTHEILQKLLNEKKAAKEKGTIDIIWINGENFKNAKENDLLFGPITEKLPNFQKYIDIRSLNTQYDFGTAVEGLEAPWGKVQFVFLYDANKISQPPKTFAELKDWIKEHPGKFTYPDPTDFTGNAFLRHLLYEAVGGSEKLLKQGYNPQFVKNEAEKMWAYLNEIKPYLWREGETYPNSLTELDRMYSQGEVWMTMGYNEARAESLIKNGTFPTSTRSFVLESGSIGNTHFLAIPFNSPNKAGAMVTINFLLSPQAQLEKFRPTYWGEGMSLDPNKLSEQDQQTLKQINRGKSVLSSDVLKKHLLPEVDSRYVDWLKENWLHEVVQKK
ncbi:putative spermidine/putrescine transport system substrate-binding protein [Anoxybacillus voinovskiensis]|uniref:Putative spermidine/putrescine transport system substrate-binding protein n=1 Tax=Anoxybacteroides voinovskiense TaxID=230470 RepID=A0A840DQU4_9BACL|nr:ABC transporter substrate-binding protein [Anoxybacillus voinovskiensis]MBB4075454.1 putative spermidine/putrescine transport system substrate-binding protein [Anoxybacillus voinovskiensis]GGJ79449.1 ABC transporter substrate-binding protein [Anoxybacillus voinovskiensis]